jgi:hypothetical protein
MTSPTALLTHCLTSVSCHCPHPSHSVTHALTHSMSLFQSQHSTHEDGASSLDEMDPSLADGFHVIYDREVSEYLSLHYYVLSVSCCFTVPISPLTHSRPHCLTRLSS